MKRVYRLVLHTTTRSQITGSVTYYVCQLECGHTVEKVKWKKGWRARTNPVPTKVLCPDCSNGEVHSARTNN